MLKTHKNPVKQDGRKKKTKIEKERKSDENKDEKNIKLKEKTIEILEEKISKKFNNVENDSMTLKPSPIIEEKKQIVNPIRNRRRQEALENVAEQEGSFQNPEKKDDERITYVDIAKPNYTQTANLYKAGENSKYQIPINSQKVNDTKNQDSAREYKLQDSNAFGIRNEWSSMQPRFIETHRIKRNMNEQIHPMGTPPEKKYKEFRFE